MSITYAQTNISPARHLLSRPIDDALAALRRTLEEAGKVAEVERHRG